MDLIDAKKAADKYHGLRAHVDEIKIANSGRNLRHFLHITNNISTPAHVVEEKIERKIQISALEQLDISKSLRYLELYLKMINNYPDFREGEFENSNGYFDDLPCGSAKYITGSYKRLNGEE